MGTSYRPDIDGMRAVAVLFVLLFHLDPTTVSGGFIGVDIFFIISGFLITRMIVTGLEQEDFSFVQFYSRRMRRLFPAFFVTIVGCLIAGAIWYLPDDLDRLGKSAVFSVFSIANFLFWSEAGYFDGSALDKPLLHTWSLSVEEQFYLLWPVTLVLLWRLVGTRLVVFLCASTSILSLIAGEMWLDIDPAGAFFLLPTRIMEFGIGALMVWLSAFRPRRQALLEPIFLLGLTAIVVPALTYTEETAFPGLAALLPCAGAAALIYSGQARYLGNLLRNRVMVSVGLISYSLYLVHWPIIVFYQYDRLAPLGPTDHLLIVALSLGLATLSFSFVEKPFRLPKGRVLRTLSAPQFIAACASVAILLSIPAGILATGGGWPERFPKSPFVDFDKQRERRATWNLIEEGEHHAFPSHGVAVAVLGNSHAKGVYIGMSQHPATRANGVFLKPFITNRMCQGIDARAAAIDCKFRYSEFFESEAFDRVDWVVLASAWRDRRILELPGVLGRLRAAGKKVVLVGNTAQFFDVPKAAALLSIRGESIPEIALRISSTRQDYVDRLSAELKAVADRHGAHYIDRAGLICGRGERNCQVIAEDGTLLFYDTQHLTVAGATNLGNALVNDTPLLNLLSGMPRTGP